MESSDQKVKKSHLIADDSMKWTKIVGTKFKPTDEILANHYLAGKISGRSDGIFKLIKEVDIYKHEPSGLSSLTHDFGDGMMYFFTTLKKKYQKGANVDRLTQDGNGFWKKTGCLSYVKSKNGKQIASKTPLAYYRNDPKSGKPVKTQWLMKEYMLLQKQSDEKSKTLALCVVYHHCKRRKQSASEIQFCAEKNEESSTPLMEEGSSKYMATASRSSLPPSKISKLYCQQSPCSASCSDSLFSLSSNLHNTLESLVTVKIPVIHLDPNMGSQGATNSEIFSGDISMLSNENLSNACCSNFPLNLTSNLQDSLESLVFANSIPIANSDQNMPNSVMGSQVETDSNLELDLETIADIRHWLQTEDTCESPHQFSNCLLSDEQIFVDQPQPDRCENPNSAVRPFSSTKINNDLLDQNMNLNHNFEPRRDPAESIWSPVSNFLTPF